jgi:type IV pilus assembly protein PilB
MAARKRLGELLREAGLIDEEDLLRALDVQQATGERLGSTLLRLGLVRPEMLTRMLADQLETDGVDLETIDPPPEVLALIPEELAFELGCLPLRAQGKRLLVAVSDPEDHRTLERLEEAAGRRVVPVVAPQMALFRAIKRHYAGPLSEARLRAIRQHLGEVKRLVAEVERLLFPE